MALKLLKPFARALLRQPVRAATTVRAASTDSYGMQDEECPVCVYNEWDPLEEIIVGRADGAAAPKLRPELKAVLRPEFYDYFAEHGGGSHPPEAVEQAIKEANEFQTVLEGEGVRVRRPDRIEWSRIGSFTTPDWTEPVGFAMACPRDSVTVVGNELIEAPMAWRARYFETRPYKTLLNVYFEKGARWTLAPKPTMNDHCYRDDLPYMDEEAREKEVRQGKFVITEAEPMFDAAEIQRVGKDIFYQLSNSANFKGLEWLKRHLGRQGYRVHGVNCIDTHALHVDCTLVFLKPGVVLTNPKRPCLQLDLIKKAGWDVYECPAPTVTADDMLYASAWLSMNVLMLDENRVVMYSKEETLKKFFEDKLGLKCIGVDMTTAFNLGGAYHCWTLDVKRKGSLKDYGFGNIDFDAALNNYQEPYWQQTKYH